MGHHSLTSVNSISHTIHLTQSSVEPEYDNEELEGPEIDIRDAISIHISNDHSSASSHHSAISTDETDSSKRQNGFRLIVKEVVHKIRCHLGVDEPSYSPDNGPYQPFAERAICLSNYGIIGRGLNQGLSSHVHLLRKAHEKPLAAKIFKKCKRNASRPEYMKNIISEFSISYACRHQNILRTHDLVKLDNDYNKFALIMDFCYGGDVSTLIGKRKLERDEMYSLFKQLLYGVKYLHDEGVAHRDLKPENLLLQGHILKIADFGSADVFRGDGDNLDQMSSGKVGTGPYMAPEIHLNKPYWGPAVDIWSVGIIFFAMYFGCVPFEHATMENTEFWNYMDARTKKEYAPFNKASPKACALLYKMLSPNCNERPTIDEILALSWIQNLPTEYETETEIRRTLFAK